MLMKRVLVYAGVVLAAVLAVPHAHGSALVVGTCLKGYFEVGSIQSAVVDLPSGGTAYICPGTYHEQVLINKSVTLIGLSDNGVAGSSASGANNPTVVPPTNGVIANATDLRTGRAPIAAQLAIVTPAGSTKPIVVNISNLTVDGSNNGINGGCSPNIVGIFYQNASGTVNHVAIRYQYQGPNAVNGCQSGLGIFAEENNAFGATKITVENSSVHDYNKNGITVSGLDVPGNVTATITGNYVVGVGATSAIAQNGIEISSGATGKVTGNTVTDDVYINPEGGPYASASGILLYDSGGTSSTVPLLVQSNTVSNTQGAIVAYGDASGNADFVKVTSNKITSSPAAGIYDIDGIDLCGNNETATSNTVFNSSGAGIHIDSQCSELSGPTGNNTTVTSNTIVDACAGVLLGGGTGNTDSSNTTYDVLQTTYAGDTCPSGAGPQHVGQRHNHSPYARAIK